MSLIILAIALFFLVIMLYTVKNRKLQFILCAIMVAVILTGLLVFLNSEEDAEQKDAIPMKKTAEVPFEKEPPPPTLTPREDTPPPAKPQLPPCEERKDLPGRFLEYSLILTDKQGKPVRNKVASIRQRETDFIHVIQFSDIGLGELSNSLQLECTEYTPLTYRERGELSASELDIFCQLQRMAADTREVSMLPVSCLRIEPARIPPGIDFEEYREADLKSQEDFLRLLAEHDARIDLLLVCGEWNLKSQEAGFNLDEAVQYAQSVIDLAKKYFPNSSIGIDLLPVYYYPERDLCCPLCESWVTGSDAFLTDFAFLDELVELNAPFDVISLEYQMGSEHKGGAEELIFLTERFRRYDKEIYYWDVQFPSHIVEILEETTRVWRKVEPEEGFTEDWQKQQFNIFLDYVYNNEWVIGFHLVGYQDPIRTMVNAEDVPAKFFTGILREDGSKKPSYFSYIHFLDSLFTTCSVYSDENGRITFRGTPGFYEIFVEETEEGREIHLDEESRERQITLHCKPRSEKDK
jgi:hypothetical protein